MPLPKTVQVARLIAATPSIRCRPLADAALAHSPLETRQTSGKLVLEPR